MCILVTRAPNSKMTKPSLEELDLVAHLFEEAAPSCRAAANTLVRLYLSENFSYLPVAGHGPNAEKQGS